MSLFNPTTAGGPRPALSRWTRIAARPISPTSVVAHIGMITCILLQRFAIPLGAGTSLSVSLPVFWGLTLWLLLSKRGRFVPGRSLMFLLFVSWAILSAVAALVVPDPRVGFSILSLMNVLFLYLPLNVRPTGDFDGRIVREVFLFYARVCAAFGIVQFALQFVHIRLFSFGELVPALKPFLLESGFNWNPVLAYGSATTRSNGFFLIEPSMFSQLLCLAILIDLFIVNRWRYLLLYAVAYMSSYSGTGILILGLSLVVVGFTSVRYSLRVIGLAIIGIAVAAMAAIVLPDQFGIYAGRLGELGSNRTSGYQRFIAPLLQIDQFSDGPRMLLGYGPGSTMRSIYYASGTGNTASQLFIDYGVIGLILFVSFILIVIANKKYVSIVVLLVVMFELGGSYLLFMPYIFLFTMLGIWMPTEPKGGISSATRPRIAPGPRARQLVARSSH